MSILTNYAESTAEPQPAAPRRYETFASNCLRSKSSPQATLMTSIAERYRALVHDHRFQNDSAQASLVGKLDALAEKLKTYKAEAKPSGFSRLFGVKPAEP